MAVSYADAAAWAGVVSSVIFSTTALAVSVRSLRHAQRAADAAERQAVAAELAVPPAPPPVSWQAELPRTRWGEIGTPYVIRNVGSEPATGVEVMSRGFKISRIEGLDEGVVLPGASFVVILNEWISTGSRTNEILLLWDGQTLPVGIALPPRPPEPPPIFVKTTPIIR
ncbi:hypothetical protein SAMN05443287_102346 [Micromonospora phaseoli]|uniref:Uncharacterized protein n=1 Tax=Micromonospora phaseoli TaxID=1144548 RepID=A0A1H6V2U2_9ACTN|nr:hypothetical protein [Micromonospora phaseoli]PZV99110.1 hypothetical protein CLV64_104347 [Micromonospora phaseoli]SEI94572.1 hypothetical protein SAMN05443287_102346 [Micromonospora phaseoli]